MTAFNEHCNEIVKDYVQTVLIIDDQAGLGLNTAFDLEPIEDPTSNNPLLESENKSQSSEVGDSTEKPVVESHQLDALKLTNAFYENGIVAGLYQPQITNDDINDFATKAGKVAATADIIILDWMLKGSDDNYSKAIVKKILESDLESGGRIRNII
uniref:response regulator receiver domain n=1 Tax=Pseudoalteromonas marina TaxID=267375 RepID=UPI0023F50CCF